MDSLKIPKGSSNNNSNAGSSGGSNVTKSAGNIPITVRFNAGDECIDDIFQSFHNSNSTGGGVGTAASGLGGGGSGGVGGGGGDSLSSSPSQQQHQHQQQHHHQQQQQQHHLNQAQQNTLPVDEVNTRNNFLQGNFFNRKRSGSIETISPTNPGASNTLAASLGSSGLVGITGGGSASGGGDVSPVGTWKLIKGKVSQTIEDIKSSKSSSGTGQVSIVTTTSGGKVDSHDIEADLEHSEASELSAVPEIDHHSTQSHQAHHHHQTHHHQSHHHHQRHHHSKAGDSDTDTEQNEVILETDGDRSRLKRGLANLKSKVKTKAASHHHRHHHHQQQPEHEQKSQMDNKQPPTATGNLSATSSTGSLKSITKDLSPSRSSSSTTSLRSHFLRKRHKQPVETAELATPSAAPDVTLSAAASKTERKASKGIIAGHKEVHEIESGVEMLEDMLPPNTSSSDLNAGATLEQQQKRQGMDLPLKSISSNEYASLLSNSNDIVGGDGPRSSKMPKPIDGSDGVGDKTFWFNLWRKHGDVLWHKGIRPAPALTILILTIIVLSPIPDFIRGVFACLLTIALLETFVKGFQGTIEYFLVTNPPEHTKFQIPDYSKMSICEIPAVEEHKTVKTYAGWMNEVNSYDPNTFHISMTRSVYVRLEGTIMHIATTTARIPKRVMWNEPPIDKKTITFIEHRTYNLLGCRIELLPLGLARKRYFNRKYPIQLIIKNNCSNTTITEQLQSSRMSSKRPSSGSSHHRGSAYDDADVEGHDSKQKFVFVNPQTSGESLDDVTERPFVDVMDNELDFSSTILNSDLQSLQELISTDGDNKEMTVPCGDEVRLLLFTRGDREKEDWYRRFVAASTGDVHDQDLRLSYTKFVTDTDLQAAAARAAILLTADLAVKTATDEAIKTATTAGTGTGTGTSTGTGTGTPATDNIPSTSHAKSVHITSPSIASSLDVGNEQVGDNEMVDSETLPFAGPMDDNTFEGLLMTACAARNPADYIRFMALYQRACNITQIPVYKKLDTKNPDGPNRRNRRRAKRQEDELWKGIDQSLFLGPSGSVVWFNVFVGRILYSCLKDSMLHGKIQEFLQKKLSSIKLPSFMEDVVITQINLGDTPPLIHRISRPMLDERGTWIDADITYEGLLHITVTTKLNLLRLRRQAKPTHMSLDLTAPPNVAANMNLPPINVIPDDVTTPSMHSLSSLPEGEQQQQQQQQHQLMDDLSGSAIFDSDAESSGGSSSEAESPTASTTNEANNATEFNVFNTSPGNARRIFKIVDRFASSNFFQYATELPYVQRAMENMSANITLRVELKGLVGRGIINLPPPPSDRIWLSFRGPPRLWITAKPAVGDKSLDWSIVTNVIESKLCESVNKYLVYPNMVDITIPFLGQPTYNRE